MNAYAVPYISQGRQLEATARRERHRARTRAPDSLLPPDCWPVLMARFGLSARQMQVAALVCAALDVWAIAAELQVSVATVRLHLRALHRRLGVNSRLALVLALLRAVPPVPASASLVSGGGVAVAAAPDEFLTNAAGPVPGRSLADGRAVPVSAT